MLVAAVVAAPVVAADQEEREQGVEAGAIPGIVRRGGQVPRGRVDERAPAGAAMLVAAVVAAPVVAADQDEREQRV